MDKYFKKLLVVFIFLVIIKIILAALILSPTQMADEYWYQRMAQSFFREGKFLINERPSAQYPPLYSIVISPSFIFKDMRIIYFFMKAINAIISSTIIFAGFLIAKEFANNKRAFKTAILISLIPPMFGFFPYILAENLFYPLFLFAIYFMYKSLTKQKRYWPILTGTFIGLCGLTKITGLLLAPIYGLVLFLKLFKEKDAADFFKKGVLSSFSFFAVFGWWMLRNYLRFENVFGQYNRNITNIKMKVFSSTFIKAFSLLVINNFSYLVIASLIIFFIYALLSYKKNGKYSWFYILSFATIITYILFISMYNFKPLDPQLSRLQGRYFAQLIPLIIIMGSYGFNENYLKLKNKLWICLLSIIFVISGFRFVKERLVPVNNMSLSYLEVIGIIFNFLYSNYLLIIFLGLLPLSLILLRKLRFKNLIKFALIIFILINILNFGIAYYNSNYRWYNQEPTQIALWLNSLNIDKNAIVVFDYRDNTTIDRVHGYSGEEKYKDYSSAITRSNNALMPFWINCRVISYNPDYDTTNLALLKERGADYVVSPYKINLELIKEGKKVYVYKV